MTKYIVFDIENVEPMKVSSTLMQLDSEYSRNYIPGSAIRGAYISNYINENKVKELNCGIHKEKLLKGGIKFLNAYPIISENRSLPSPKCFYALKDDIKKYSIKNRMNISMICEDSNKDFDRVKGFDFVNFNSDKNILETRKIKKINSLHIKNEARNKIYRYEAINPKENFRGIIKCENDDYAREIKDILKKGLFYIGGSKGSGYGKCIVSNINTKDENPEAKIFEDRIDEFEDAETFSIYALSDILYRDKFGIYKSYIDEEYLKEKLDLKEVKFKDSSIDMEYFTGFNNKWRCGLPIVNGIKMGSILTYKFEGELKYSIIKKFEEIGIGERRQDGFGRFVILPDIMENIYFKDFRSIASSRNEEKTMNEIMLKKREDKEQFSMILDRIYLNKINKELPKYVLDIGNRVNLNLSRNQFDKLTELMDILLGMKYEDGIKRLEEYFNHISERKINRDLVNALKKPFIDGESLRNYMLKKLKNNNQVDFENEYAQPIKIGGVRSNLRDGVQSMYKYKVKIFKEIFRLQLKHNPKGGEI
jgi:CRISPR-associated protein Csx10